ncbi:hypothetical protein EGP99_03390 [bacterium]|jgi:membrane protein|nr:hypothetical protein [bacterium]
MKRKITILLIMTFIILIFKNYEIVLKSTLDATTIWLNKVFPYLFIMIIIQDLLINLNFSSFFKNTAIYIFIMSLLSGTPSGTYIISKLKEQNIITKEYANTCLIFTFFANPLFLYSILNSIFLSKLTTIRLMLILYLTNLILYFIYKKDLPSNGKSINTNEINLSSSIKTSINTTITVLGVITFYLILSNIIITEFNIIYPFNIFFKGFLEMTQGLASLINSSIKFKEVIAMIFISFGGFSIHTQVSCILNEANLSYKYFFKGRIIQTALVVFLTIIT